MNRLDKAIKIMARSEERCRSKWLQPISVHSPKKKKEKKYKSRMSGNKENNFSTTTTTTKKNDSFVTIGGNRRPMKPRRIKKYFFFFFFAVEDGKVNDFISKTDEFLTAIPRTWLPTSPPFSHNILAIWEKRERDLNARIDRFINISGLECFPAHWLGKPFKCCSTTMRLSDILHLNFSVGNLFENSSLRPVAPQTTTTTTILREYTRRIPHPITELNRNRDMH